jgi:ATP-dependent exoDNAse (exonuclease V) beta subunit
MSTKPMALPSDHAARDRFVRETNRNFSVIAPAGVGKTKAIVDRVIHIATADPAIARDILPRLVVVTYTNKAADEMQQRARHAIVAGGVDLSVLAPFNRAFFGTIHSFSLHLLQTHGYHLGLPGALRVASATELEALWMDFIRQLDTVAPGVPEAIRADCFRFRPMEKVFELARRARPGMVPPRDPGPCPRPDLGSVLAHVESNKRSADAVSRSQAAARVFQEAANRGEAYVRIPDCETTARVFSGLWERAFAPLREWLNHASWHIAADIASAFRQHRIAQGWLTFDDQVELAFRLVRHADAGRAIRAEGYRVILDEAQDTDPAQFRLLLEVARPPEAEGVWLESGGAPPRAGHFSMVGDPQQSIYGDRADLAVYSGVRSDLLSANAAEELVFDVTFRCDQQVIDTVNACGPSLLDGLDGQTAFVPLTPRPNVGPGQVVRLRLDPPPSGSSLDTRARERHQAVQLAQWIKAQGLERLRARDWSEVAILCPRKRWLAPIRAALQQAGLASQVQSERDVHGDRPAFAWFAALVAVMADPRNGYELAGVLREIFGVSDQALADFTLGDGARLRIDAAPEGGGPVGAALRLLFDTRSKARALPLRDAARHLVDASRLRERLRAIGESGGHEVDDELDALLLRAAQAEADGLSMRAWAVELRELYYETVDSRSVEPGAVQMITCHKAKGLQWDAVVLPFLFRKIGDVQAYPVLVQGRPGEPPLVLFDADDRERVTDVLQRRKRHEHERLLYVAMTRARRTLVLADDQGYYAKCESSFGDFLGGAGAGTPAWWTALPETPEPGPPLVRTDKAGNDAAPPAVPSAKAVEAAARHAAAFPRRTLPSSLVEKSADVEPEAALDREPEWDDSAAAAARAYGTWWHETVERMNWRAGRDAWQAVFDDRLAICPQPDRARREWSLFLASEMPGRLSAPGVIVHAEMPFLSPIDPAQCREGVIDAALFDPGRRRWLVMDWKTNVVDLPHVGSLKDLYAPQVRAYAQALEQVSGCPADCGVYSTATGAWVPC